MIRLSNNNSLTSLHPVFLPNYGSKSCCAPQEMRETSLSWEHIIPIPTHFPKSFQLMPPIFPNASEPRYNSWLKWKASLTTVCSLFNAVAQEVLYKDVWITSLKDGMRLAERLGGSADTRVIRISNRGRYRNRGGVVSLV
jgi:hypothetical protein